MNLLSRLKEIEARCSAIRAESEQEGADLEALASEAKDLQEERTDIIKEMERRNTLNSVMNDGGANVIKDFVPTEERTYTAASPEYREAFFANLLGREMTKEQRAAWVHTTTNTAAVVPTETVNAIWDLISEQHSIIDDVTIYRSGTVMEVIKHTEIAQGTATKVAENAANEDEKNIFVTVKLSGNDFSKHVKLSYALAKMSIESFESYIVNELSSELGRAIADDLIETVKTGISATNKMTVASLTFKDVAKVFGTLKRVSGTTIYTNYSTLFNHLVSMTDTTGRPIYQVTAQEGARGALLGANIRLEESLADGEILIGDPKRIIYNLIQDIMIESDRDIENHNFIYSGYCRGEGVLVDDKSFALLTVTPATGGV